MFLYQTEIDNLSQLSQQLSGRFPKVYDEILQLIESEKEVVMLLYSRRCLEILIREICLAENIKISDTIPLKGIIDKLNKEEKVPSNIITSMHNLNSSSVYGAHPKEFNTGQVRTALINLASVLKWFIEFKEIDTSIQPAIESLANGKVNLEVSPQKKSIIVLPFENMSSDAEQEYFSDGLTEEIITDLSYIHDLLVISRSSTMTFKGSKKKISEISREVNVTHVLEGSVRKAGNRIRVVAQLIDAKTDSHLWAGKFDGILEDVFEIQSTISLSIVEAIKLNLNEEENRILSSHPIDNVEAFESYLKARKLMWEFNPDNLVKAEEEVHKAIEITGDNELLFATLGWIYNQYVESGHSNGTEYLKKSEYLIQKLLQQHPGSAQAFGLQGVLYHHKGQIQEAVNSLKNSLIKLPNNPDVLLMICYCYIMSGKADVANPLMERLILVDPLSPVNHSILGFAEACKGNFFASLQHYKKMHSLSSLHPVYSLFYSWSLALNQKFSEALDLIDKIVNTFEDSVFIRLAKLFKSALLGKREVDFDLIGGKEVLAIKSTSFLARFTSYCYALLGEKDQSIDYLETTVQLGFINFPYLSEYSPFLKNIRETKRFKQLMEKVKPEWENFKV